MRCGELPRPRVSGSAYTAGAIGEREPEEGRGREGEREREILRPLSPKRMVETKLPCTVIELFVFLQCCPYDHVAGLSSFRSTPQRAYSSLVPLLKLAASHIPSELHPTTNIYVLGTAGLRLVPARERNAILAAVFSRIRAQYRFNIQADHVRVISGQMEGVFGWIAVNYALSRLSRSSDGEWALCAADTYQCMYMSRFFSCPHRHRLYNYVENAQPA